jgi:hypothetical protein
MDKAKLLTRYCPNPLTKHQSGKKRKLNSRNRGESMEGRDDSATLIGATLQARHNDLLTIAP